MKLLLLDFNLWTIQTCISGWMMSWFMKLVVKR